MDEVGFFKQLERYCDKLYFFRYRTFLKNEFEDLNTSDHMHFLCNLSMYTDLKRVMRLFNTTPKDGILLYGKIHVTAEPDSTIDIFHHEHSCGVFLFRDESGEVDPYKSTIIYNRRI